MPKTDFEPICREYYAIPKAQRPSYHKMAEKHGLPVSTVRRKILAYKGAKHPEKSTAGKRTRALPRVTATSIPTTPQFNVETFFRDLVQRHIAKSPAMLAELRALHRQIGELLEE